MAYEPPDSTHKPSSGPGAELIVILSSDSHRFLENHMPDGSTFDMDMAFFQLLDGMTLEQATNLQIPQD